MKWFVASDIHGSKLYCQKMLEAFVREKADRMVLLGDYLYHGPRNELPEGYDPKAVSALLNEYASVIFGVRGNCDAEVDQMMLQFPIMADQLLLENEGHLIVATHGHLYGPEQWGHLPKGDIILQGHTHVPEWRDDGEHLFLNPGSVSIPKKDSPRGYLLIEGERFIWKNLDGNVYHFQELNQTIAI